MTVKLHFPQFSGNVAAYGYDAENKTLHVRFKSGGHTYVYPRITSTQFEELHAASSKGKWVFDNLVRPKAEFEKRTPEPEPPDAA